MDKPETEIPKPQTSNFMLPAYGELFKSTAIHGAVIGNLSGFKENAPLYTDEKGQIVTILNQLVTYSRNSLRIYNIEATLASSKLGDRKFHSIKLNFLNEYPLFGEIKKVNLIESPIDPEKKLLIVTLDEHKLSILSLDPLTNSLSTVDLFNFENQDTEVFKKGQKSFIQEVKVKVDEINKCIGISILTCLKDTLTCIFTKKLYESFGVNFQNLNTTPNYTTFSNDSSSLFPAVFYLNLSDYNLRNPIDFAFSLMTRDKEPKLFILNDQIFQKQNGVLSKFNTCEVVAMKLMTKFFNSTLLQKNKILQKPCDNLEIYECFVKIKYLPSDSFKIIFMPRGGFVVITNFSILYFSLKDKIEYLGFLVNQSVQNTEDIKESYYKYNIINNNPDTQLYLRNFKFNMINHTTMMLTGIGVYLLKFSFRKDGSLENMELRKIPELAETRNSFCCIPSKPLKDNTFMLFMGSYMTNSRLFDIEILSEPISDFGVNKKSQHDDGMMLTEDPDLSNAFWKLNMRDTLEAFAPFTDLISPKQSSASKGYDLIGGCCYGNDSSILFIQNNVRLYENLENILDIDSMTNGVFSLRSTDTMLTKYIFLSKNDSTKVLLQDKGNLMIVNPDNDIFIQDQPTIGCKTVILDEILYYVQATVSKIRFYNPELKKYFEWEKEGIVDCQIRTNKMAILTSKGDFNMLTLRITNEGLFASQDFEQKNISCFSILKRNKAFPNGWKQNDLLIGLCYKDNSFRVFWFSTMKEHYECIFYCPYLNEGISALINIQEAGDSLIPSLLTRSITNPTVLLDMKMKASNPHGVQEIFLKEMNFDVLLIVRNSNGEFFFYKSFVSEFNNNYTLGYNIGFYKILFDTPLIRVLESKKEATEEESKLEVEKKIVRRKTIIEYAYKGDSTCLFLSSKGCSFWVFIKDGVIRMHSSKNDPSADISHICDFGMPGYENLFLGISNSKLCGYSIQTDVNYNYPVPLVKYELGNIRNILAYPHDKPKYLIFTTSPSSYGSQHTLNLFEIKNLRPLDSVNFEESSKILKIKTLDISINGKIFSLLVVILYSKKPTPILTHSTSIIIYMINEEKSATNQSIITFKKLLEIEQKSGIASDVFALSGYLFICLGNIIQKVQITMTDENEFKEKSELCLSTDKFLITETLVLPMFIICSDIRRSISLVHYNGDPPKLSVQADSFRNHTLYATEFYDSGDGILRLIISDDEKNIFLLSYSAREHKIEKVADFNAGALISKFRKHKVLDRNENIIVGATNEGSISFIASYEKSRYQSITKLQNFLRRDLPHLSGLNPEAYRMQKTTDLSERTKPKKNFLDGRLLNLYYHLSYGLQKKIATAFGSTREEFMNLIYNLFGTTNLF